MEDHTPKYFLSSDKTPIFIDGKWKTGSYTATKYRCSKRRGPPTELVSYTTIKNITDNVVNISGLNLFSEK